MFGNTKSPVALVTSGADLVPFDSLMSVIVAPGMTPPCVSLIVPDTVPVTPWPEAGRDIARSNRHSGNASPQTFRFDMRSLLLLQPRLVNGRNIGRSFKSCQYRYWRTGNR